MRTVKCVETGLNVSGYTFADSSKLKAKEARTVVTFYMLREQGQIGKSLKPSMGARPAPSMARDAFLL